MQVLDHGIEPGVMGAFPVDRGHLDAAQIPTVGSRGAPSSRFSFPNFHSLLGVQILQELEPVDTN